MIVHKKETFLIKYLDLIKEIKEKANKIKENQFNKSHTRSTRIEYTGYNDTKYITLNDPNCYANCSCSCSNFLKRAICNHVVAYSHCINKNWYGMKYNLNNLQEIQKKAQNQKVVELVKSMVL